VYDGHVDLPGSDEVYGVPRVDLDEGEREVGMCLVGEAGRRREQAAHGCGEGGHTEGTADGVGSGVQSCLDPLE
jgi:hypothetical protein